MKDGQFIRAFAVTAKFVSPGESTINQWHTSGWLSEIWSKFNIPALFLTCRHKHYEKPISLSVHQTSNIASGLCDLYDK
jgi:hypothetical protein